MKDEVTPIGTQTTPEQGEFKPGRRLYLDKDGKVVEANDPTKLTKLVTEHGSIPMAQARALGLLDKAEVEPETTEAKAIDAPPENKARTMPAKPKRK